MNYKSINSILTFAPKNYSTFKPSKHASRPCCEGIINRQKPPEDNINA